MNELALFAGAGGGILGGVLLGWRTVCAVEINAFCARRLMQRQNEGHLPPFPIWDDVCTFDGRPWRGVIDVVSGGFPCQDISVAGKGQGIDGERSGLWGQMARIIREVRPKYVLVENSPAITTRGIGRILGDLAKMGMDARWGMFCGDDPKKYPCKGERWFLLASSDGFNGSEWLVHIGDGVHQKKSKCQGTPWEVGSKQLSEIPISIALEAIPDFIGMDNGLANWMDSIKAIGNGQIPILVVNAWETLID